MTPSTWHDLVCLWLCLITLRRIFNLAVLHYKMTHPTFAFWFWSKKMTADIQRSPYDWNKSLNVFLLMQCSPVTIRVSQLKATPHMSHPVSNQSVWALLKYTESRGSCPHQATRKENFIMYCKNKTLTISCLSFLPSGWKGISRLLYLRWIRGAFEVSAQGKVIFQQHSNQWKHSWSMKYITASVNIVVT